MEFTLMGEINSVTLFIAVNLSLIVLFCHNGYCTDSILDLRLSVLINLIILCIFSYKRLEVLSAFTNAVSILHSPLMVVVPAFLIYWASIII